MTASPSGRARTDAHGNPSLWRIDSDGGGLIRLVRGAYSPAWSPGGRRIAYFDPAVTSGSRIHVIRPDGTDDRIAAAPDEHSSYSRPTWSPDGQRLAFSVSSAPDSSLGPSGIGITHDYGAKPMFLLHGHYLGNLAWSPSGREIAFEEGGVISLIYLRTGRVKRLRSGSRPSWSPDGKQLAFASYFMGGSIYVMNRDGSRLRLLLKGS